MKLEIPGQLRGRDAGKVMPVAIKIRRELEASFAALGNQKLKLISPILRVGGELGTFGADALENIKIAGRKAVCDVVIEEQDWKSMSGDQLASIVRPRIITALATLLTEAGYDPLPDFLRDEINQAEQVVVPNRSLAPTLKSTSSVRGSEDF